MPRRTVPPAPYVASRVTSNDMMLQPETTDSVLGFGGTMDAVGEPNTSPTANVPKADNLAGTPGE